MTKSLARWTVGEVLVVTARGVAKWDLYIKCTRLKENWLWWWRFWVEVVRVLKKGLVAKFSWGVSLGLELNLRF